MTGNASDRAVGETAAATDELLTVEDLQVSYGTVGALRGIDLRIDAGEAIGVIGPNGAGKTTLADTVSGFLDYEGSVRYRGREIREHDPAELVAAGMVHCTEARDLFGYMSVRDNLELGAYRRSDGVDERLSFVYDLFPVLAERQDQDAATMSGGEQQMLAIARALMGDPDLLLLDEPTLGLAPVVRETISDGLRRIREEGVTILLAEQNVRFALAHADRIYLLENGHVEREGTPDSFRGDEYIRDTYLGG